MSPGAQSFSLQAADVADNGDIYVGLHGHNFPGDNIVNMVRANITFDPAVVQLVSYSSADSWLEANGYEADFSVTRSGNVLKIRVDTRSASAGASGSGRILRLRFRKVASGSSRLDFIEAHAYDAGFNEWLKGTHGGTLVVK
jgi:hypothetical protein